MASQVRIRTDQLDLARRASGFRTNAALATAMGMSESAVMRTLSGKAALSAEFIAGLLHAFPNLDFADLFALVAPDTAEQVPA